MARNPHPCGEISRDPVVPSGHDAAATIVQAVHRPSAPRCRYCPRAARRRRPRRALRPRRRRGARARSSARWCAPASAARGCSSCPSRRSAAICASRGRTRARPTSRPGSTPDGPEIARLIELAGDVVVCAGYTRGGRRRPLRVGDLRQRRRRARPPAQGPPAARRALRLHRRATASPPSTPRSAGSGCCSATTSSSPRRRARWRSTAPTSLCSLSAWPVDRHAPRAADPRRHPDAPLRPLRPDARGREPGLRGVGEPDRALGAAALPRLGQGRRPRAARCSPAPARARASRSREVDLAAVDEIAARSSTISPTAGRTPTRRRGRRGRARLRPLSGRVAARDHVRHRRGARRLRSRSSSSGCSSGSRTAGPTTAAPSRSTAAGSGTGGSRSSTSAAAGSR